MKILPKIETNLCSCACRKVVDNSSFFQLALRSAHQTQRICITLVNCSNGNVFTALRYAIMNKMTEQTGVCSLLHFALTAEHAVLPLMVILRCPEDESHSF